MLIYNVFKTETKKVQHFCTAILFFNALYIAPKRIWLLDLGSNQGHTD